MTLFLATEAALEPFYASHAMLAKTLDESGHAAIVLGCRGAMSVCTLKFAMKMAPTPAEKPDNEACVACRSARERTVDDYELLEISLESLLDANDQDLIKATCERFASQPWTAELDGIDFGTICLAEVLRDRRKHAVAELDSADLGLLAGLLQSSLSVYLAVQKLRARFNLHQIAYFGEYAYWLAPQVIAARHGIGLLALSHGYHRDIDRRLLSIRPRHYMVHAFEQIDAWKKFRGYPIEPKVVSEIASGALYRLSNQGGASTYSPTWSNDSEAVFEQLGLSRARRTLVAYPSSHDEFVCIAGQLKALGEPYADRPQPFADQETWLRELVDWISKRDDLQLVLRMHPRMGVGHRHSTASSDYRRLKEAFATLPSNVVVIWPESKVSSYSVAEFADAALISWSSMGLELARFGVPIVASFQRIGLIPLSNFVTFEESADRYFSAVDAAVSETASVEKIVEAFRWTHYLHWGSLIDVSDLIPTPDFAHVPAFVRPANRELMLKSMVDRSDVTELNMARLDTSASAHAAEGAALRSAIEQIIGFFDPAALEELKAGAFASPGRSRLVSRLLDLIREQEPSIVPRRQHQKAALGAR